MNVLEQADKLVTDVATVVEGVNSMKGAIEKFGQDKYTEGWDAAMVQNGQANAGDKLYSEAEMNEELAKKDAEKQAALDSQKAEFDTLIEGLKVENDAAIATAKESAKSELKAELKAKLQEQQASETQSESNFASLLD